MPDTTNNISTENTAASAGDESILQLLNTIGSETLTNANTERVLNSVITAVADHIGADNAYIMLKNNHDNLENTASIHRTGQDDSLVTVSSNVTAKVIETGAGVVVTNAMQSNQFPGDPKFQRFNINSVVCAAIRTGELTFGLIYADSTAGDSRWNNSQLELLDFIGRHIALAVNSIQTVQKVKRLIAVGEAALKLSHSVKNILQMVAGAAEVIDFGLRTNQMHRVRRSWDILKPNLERMRKFTLDMLDYSKERKLELGPCDFNRVIQGAIESLKSQLKQKKSRLHIRIDQNIPTLELDEERIHEMSLNLILNAIDIVDGAKGVVNVETRYLQDSQEVQLSVTDNGPGISEEMKEKIFTPFESGKNKFGTGLGMPIAKQIVDQHAGRIEIESKTGSGTTFRIFLPAKVIS